MFFCAITKAQTTVDLKTFINKNNVAIRTVQKNMVRGNNSAYISSFKEILKNQEAAVKLYNTNKDESSHFALLARNESLAFLKKNTTGSTEYFEITDSEKPFLKSSSEKNTTVLSADELKAIEDLDAMNSQSLNNLTLTIQ
ncbi:MAG: hypothetical protein C0448_10800 [Sphingobacteriaceae bacterium]|nr:hypothetical protein [Sphingobacteriaceae bacterium]